MERVERLQLLFAGDEKLLQLDTQLTSQVREFRPIYYTSTH